MSEKELYARNGFKNPINNLVAMIRQDGRIKHPKDVVTQMPEKMGQYTKDNHGCVMNMGNDGYLPKFNKNNLEHMAPDPNPGIIKRTMDYISGEVSGAPAQTMNTGGS